MSFSNGVIRVEESLRIKISEAKNIPASSGSPKARSIFCKLCLDQEEVFKTAVVKRTSEPYFGEEVSFEVPRPFRYLNVYLCDKNDPGWSGQIGKVAIAKQDLHKINGKDHWYPVVPIDADSEVKGKVNLEIFRVNDRLAVRIKECSDLTVVKNSCDPYAEVTLTDGVSPQTNLCRTRIWKKTTAPRFDETFYFADEEKIVYSHHEVKVSIWHDSLWGPVFLGEVRIPLRNIRSQQQSSAWYLLKPREMARRSQFEKCAIRLNVRYSSDHIISSECYDPLRQLLLDSPSVTPVSCSAASLLADICDDKLELAKPLVRIFLHHAKLPDLIHSLAKLEMDLASDINTLFRGNSLLSKCIDELMRLAGKDYLRSVLQDLIDRVYHEGKCCEIDTFKLGDDVNDHQANLENLCGYIEEFLTAITSSALSCPALISDLLAELKFSCAEKYPERPEVLYSVVAGFILLRFFAPAILGPKLFDLRNGAMPNERISRTLTLISKAVQMVGNTLSNENNKMVLKEPYMAPVMERFLKAPYLERMRTFLMSVSSTHIIHSCPPAKLKEGYLMKKRARGRKAPFMTKDFKARYFVLTTEELVYSRHKGTSPIRRIPISEIQVAERVHEQSFNMKNIVQIVRPDRKLYVQAANCVDAKQWLDAFSFVVGRNQRKRDMYHPSSYAFSTWRCCGRVDRLDSGCCAAAKGNEINQDIDVDREVEKIYTFINTNLEKLKNLRENSRVRHDLDNAELRVATVNSLLLAVHNLDKEHRQHVHNACQRQTYGSYYAPIGDESESVHLDCFASSCLSNVNPNQSSSFT